MPLHLRLYPYAFGGCVTFGAAVWTFVLLPHPVKIPGAVTVIAAALWLFWRTERPHDLRFERETKGLCLHCGYDLTGNVSGTCPECGTRSAPQPTA